MEYPCELIQQPKQAVLTVRTHTPVSELARTIAEAYGKIVAYLGEVNEQACGEPFVAYYNMDMKALDVEMGLPVAKDLPGKDDVHLGLLPEGPAAACLFTGPYSAMEPAYLELSEWVALNGYEATGVSYEFYLNDPANTPALELKTRIMFPLKG